MNVETSDLVGELKTRIRDITGIIEARQSLFVDWRASPLDDARTMADMNITSGSTIRLVVAIRSVNLMRGGIGSGTRIGG